MIDLLRFAGLLNAAVWLGAGLYFQVGAAPAMDSDGMLNLIGPANFPYYSGAILGLLKSRFLYLQLVCSIVALLHLAAEWIYLGKYPRRRLGFLLALLVYALAEVAWLAPQLERVQLASHAVNMHPEQRAVAARNYRWWTIVSRSLGCAALVGVGVYLWRVAVPSNPTRFVTATKLHG